MVGYVRHPHPSGETITTNQSMDGITLQDGSKLGAFSSVTLPTYQCAHCMLTRPVKATLEPIGHRCTCCNGVLCDQCYQDIWDGKATCMPLQDQLYWFERGWLSELSRNSLRILQKQK